MADRSIVQPLAIGRSSEHRADRAERVHRDRQYAMFRVVADGVVVVERFRPGRPTFAKRKSISQLRIAEIGNVAAPGTSGENVRRLQFLLGLAGCVDVTTNGRYDARSIECVKSFQRDHGLVVDGLVGPRTLILIYQVAGAYDMPGLS